MSDNTVNIDEQLTMLEETKAQLKQAIVNKGQVIEDSDTFRSYVDKVTNISTLAKETADATATADTLMEGKTAYARGNKITGNLNSFENDQQVQGVGVEYAESIASDKGGRFTIHVQDTEKANMIIRGNTFNPYTFGNVVAKAVNLTADKILKGNTILGVAGTAEATTEVQENVTQLQTQVNTTEETLDNLLGGASK